MGKEQSYHNQLIPYQSFVLPLSLFTIIITHPTSLPTPRHLIPTSPQTSITNNQYRHIKKVFMVPFGQKNMVVPHQKAVKRQMHSIYSSLSMNYLVVGVVVYCGHVFSVFQLVYHQCYMLGHSISKIRLHVTSLQGKN